jgi:aryl-alcohol dehydrogenase-like predicted oxidoreductase
VKYRTLGATGIAVSAVGFGAWGIGGLTERATSYGKADDATSRDALAAAFEQGVTFYDTSPVYGYGRSETLIGEVFAGRRERVTIATKAGWTRYDVPPDFTPAGLRRSLEASLGRLKTDHIDLLQLHNPPPALLAEQPEILDALAALKREGKTRAIGLSAKSPAEAAEALVRHPFDAVQVNFNMLDLRALDAKLFERAAARGAGVIVRTPLAFGFLTGTITAETIFAPGDHRAAWPKAQLRAWSEGARLLSERLAVPAEENRAATALRFCLSYPAVSTVIPGILTRAEAVANARAGDLPPLAPAELAAVVEVNRALPRFGADA